MSIEQFFTQEQQLPRYTQPPEDEVLSSRIVKLAEFAARNGPSFVEVIRIKQASNSEYQFLQPQDMQHNFFRWVLYCKLLNVNYDDPNAVPEQPSQKQAGVQQNKDVDLEDKQPHEKFPILDEVKTGFSQVLDALVGTKESIKSSQNWFIQVVTQDFNQSYGMVKMMVDIVSKSDFDKQIHVIYLANDILFKCLQQKKSGQESTIDVSQAFQQYVPELFTIVADKQQQNEEGLGKLKKILEFWIQRQVFEEQFIDQIRNYIDEPKKFWDEVESRKAQIEQRRQQHNEIQQQQFQQQQQSQELYIQNQQHQMQQQQPQNESYKNLNSQQYANQSAPYQATQSMQQQQINYSQQPQQQLQYPQASIQMSGGYDGQNINTQQYNQNQTQAQNYLGQLQQPYNQQQFYQQSNQYQDQNQPQQNFQGNQLQYQQNQQQYFNPQQQYQQPQFNQYSQPVPYDHQQFQDPQQMQYAQQQQWLQQQQLGMYDNQQQYMQDQFYNNQQGYQQIMPSNNFNTMDSSAQQLQMAPNAIAASRAQAFSFPPGLLPELVKEKLRVDDPYQPLTQQEIQLAGVPSAPEMDAYLKVRVDRFYAEISEKRPGMSRADFEDRKEGAEKAEARKKKRAALRDKEVDPETGMLADGTFGGRDGKDKGSKSNYMGLGASRRDDEYQMRGNEDAFQAYRKIRSGAYHSSMGKGQSNMAKGGK